MRLRLVPKETNWDFFRYWKMTFGASAAAMVASVLLFLLVGLNFGIDFRGGTTIRTDSELAVDVGAYRDALSALSLGDVSITQVFDPTRPDRMLPRSGSRRRKATRASRPRPSRPWRTRCGSSTRP